MTTQSNSRSSDPPDLSIELLLLSFPSQSSLSVLNIKHHIDREKKINICVCLLFSQGFCLTTLTCFLANLQSLEASLDGVCDSSSSAGGVTDLSCLFVQPSLQDMVPGWHRLQV